MSRDPFTNSSSQHATEVEPAAAVNGSMIVSAFQAGRFNLYGASDIGFSTSRDGGQTWTAGTLPGTTSVVQPGSLYASASDPTVAYDAAHAVWLIGNIPVFNGPAQPGTQISRSIDGLNWSNPIAVGNGQIWPDKDSLACDNTPASPFYGHCYTEWDNANDTENGRIYLSTSVDGGLTWSAPVNTAGLASGIGGAPVVQPNGVVVVPINDYNQNNILAFVSHDGGLSWSSPVIVAQALMRGESGNLRSSPFPSAGINANGTVYVVWSDCRFRTGCALNDLVLSSSSDGVSWSAPVRIPLDPPTSTVDHFIPAIAVDPTTSGTATHLALTYYYYPNNGCSANCQLYAATVTSADGANTWSQPMTVAGPMSLGWIASTTQGFMVGDYIANVFSVNQAVGIFANANAAAGGVFDEAIYAAGSGPITLASEHLRAPRSERALAHDVSNRPLRPGP